MLNLYDQGFTQKAKGSKIDQSMETYILGNAVFQVDGKMGDVQPNGNWT